MSADFAKQLFQARFPHLVGDEAAYQAFIDPAQYQPRLGFEGLPTPEHDLQIGREAGLDAVLGLVMRQDFGLKPSPDAQKIYIGIEQIEALPPQHPQGGLTPLTQLNLRMRGQDEERAGRSLDLLPFSLLEGRRALLGDARYWLQIGLQALRESPRLVWPALANITETPQERLTVEALSREWLPIIRVLYYENQNLLKDLLSAPTIETALMLAVQGRSIADAHALQVRQTALSAHELIGQNPTLAAQPAYVLDNSHWEAGIIGGAAARLARHYKRAVLLVKMPEIENGEAIGALALPPHLQNHDFLPILADLCPRIEPRHQGARLRFEAEKFPQVRRAMWNQAAKLPPPMGLSYDFELPFEQISLAMAEDVERLAPFGMGNPRPVFVSRGLSLKSAAKVGREGQHRRLTIRKADKEDKVQQSVIWWNAELDSPPQGVFDLVYAMQPINYKGERALELVLADWEQTAEGEAARSELEIIDKRADLDLEGLKAAEPDLLIWAEGYSAANAPGLTRSRLKPAPALLIYTAPPSAQLLEAGLKRVRPERLYFQVAPPPSEIEGEHKFMASLSALLKTVLSKYDGETHLMDLAERLACPENLIEVALDCLEGLDYSLNKRNLKIKAYAGKSYQLSAAFSAAYAEMRAYRDYLRRVDLEDLEL